MGILSAQKCRELFSQIAQGDSNSRFACSELFKHIYNNKINAAARRAMAEEIAKLTHRFQASQEPIIQHSDLLFLQGVHSIYQRGFEHSETLERLNQAYAAGNGNTTAGTLLALYYCTQDLKATVSRGESWAARRYRFSWHGKSNQHFDGEKGIALLLEALAKGDLAAMLMCANRYAAYNLTALKKTVPKTTHATLTLDTIPFAPEQLNNYRTAYQWLDRAVEIGSIEARYQRALIFLQYRIATHKRDFLPDYGMEKAIEDLDIAINQGHADAMWWRFVVAGGNTACVCFSDAEKDDILVTYLIRKLHMPNAHASSQQRKQSEAAMQRIEAMIDTWDQTEINNLRKGVKTDFSQKPFHMSTEYHCWMFLECYASIEYIHNELPYELPLQDAQLALRDEQLTHLLQTMIQDDMAPEKKKFYILKNIVTYYAKQFEKFADTVLPEHYALFLQALNVMESIAPNNKAFEFIIEHYEKIPLTTVAGMRAQMSLANLYFNELLNSDGKEHNDLIDAIQTCHANVEQAYKEISNNYSVVEPALQNEYARYQQLMQDRETSTVFVKSIPAETVQQSFFSRLISWFIHLFFAPKPDEVKHNVVIATAVTTPVPAPAPAKPAENFSEQPVVYPSIFVPPPKPILTDTASNRLAEQLSYQPVLESLKMQ